VIGLAALRMQIMDDPLNTPQNAVVGLTDVLLALGEELRKANRQVGEQTVYVGEGPERQPVLFFNGAPVELAVKVTASASGGVKGLGCEHRRGRLVRAVGQGHRVPQPAGPASRGRHVKRLQLQSATLGDTAG